jgi:hypothetical protein
MPFESPVRRMRRIVTTGARLSVFCPCQSCGRVRGAADPRRRDLRNQGGWRWEWCAWQGSNLRPSDSKSDALSN